MIIINQYKILAITDIYSPVMSDFALLVAVNVSSVRMEPLLRDSVSILSEKL